MLTEGLVSESPARTPAGATSKAKLAVRANWAPQWASDTPSSLSAHNGLLLLGGTAPIAQS